ncbi:LEAF RUST 10 DISEASE-RESISTANCE LOCUS RECEPTOR-LIKE PROTEIN KINASE-like 1.2 [Coffea eugenioides]|uniref:LEAF RUST 10 DISEASE-RESISTANCE LOCUS RECEPTOR-LIKE PROTEIN KINASE-like 1.2 n=1 Tax=Coffea eugenioides TaxID=49369 RepID=UPI000F606509|nr:LEAF RUST 10 DISEASE-RESISTANCE LOCUS RECEPTOR-LIKE PROTEIN KINASE-like 1.2 [Coffea eugenioides]
MPHQPLLLLHLLPFFISFFFMKSSAGNNNSSISALCKGSKCGSIEVKYPFWIKSNATAIQYCGYEGFGLDCTPSSVPGNYNLTLHLPPVDFHVQSINYTDYKLTLVDADVTTNLSCPRPRNNLTLVDLPLNYSTQDLNLTFYFNCTRPRLPFSAYPVDCLKSGGNMSFFSLEAGTTSDPDWFKFCEEKVVVTVTEGEIEGMINGKDNNIIRNSLFSGFVLDWYRGFECAGCENSGGGCGHNNSTKEFLCFCNDGTITHDHCKGTLHFFESNEKFFTVTIFPPARERKSAEEKVDKKFAGGSFAELDSSSCEIKNQGYMQKSKVHNHLDKSIANMQSAITLDMHPVEAVLSLVLTYMTKPTKGVVHGQIQSQWRFWLVIKVVGREN